MKRYTKLLVLSLVIAMAFSFVIVPSKVMATDPITITQADFDSAKSNPGVATASGITYSAEDAGYATEETYSLAAGSYSISGNISLGDEENTTDPTTARIVLNGATILSGTGTIVIDGYYGIQQSSGTLTINGSIQFQAPVNFSGTTITINGGTFASTSSGGAVNINNANAVINGGTFTAGGPSSMYFFGSENSTLEINGGSFTSTYDNGIEIEGAKTLTITGGTFTGGYSGIAFGNVATVQLSGGTFTTTTTEDTKGTIFVFGTTNTELFENSLVSGYTFSPAANATAQSEPYEAVYTQAGTISVVSTTTQQEQNSGNNSTTETTTTEETKTVDDKTATTSNDTKTENKTESQVVAKNENTDTKQATQEVEKLIESVVSGKDVEGMTTELVGKINDAIATGKEIKIEVTTPKVEETAVKEDAEKVKEKIGQNAKVLAYYDIDVNVLIDGELAGTVTKLGDKITITLDKPSDLPAVPAGYKRVFKVVKVHNGVATELAVTENGDKCSFDSDEFSTYALTYEDVKEETVTATKTTSNPKTGDNVVIYIALLGMAVVALAVSTKLVFLVK